MKKPAKFEVRFDEAGDLRWILIAGNGAELCRSRDAFVKRGNAERALERLKAALQQVKDDDIVDAVMAFRETALKAYVVRGPGRGRRAA